MGLDRTHQERMDLQKTVDRSINLARNRGITSEEALKLIREDIEYGLTEEQILLYEKKFPKEPDKMAVYSKCLRAGYSAEAIEVITDIRLNAHQMDVAFDFYERRVSLDAVRDIVSKNIPAKRMRELLKDVLMEIESKKEDVEVAPEYVKELLSEMKDSLMALKAETNQYEALSKKLDELASDKREKEIQNNLMDENKRLTDEKIKLESLMSEQQDELNRMKKLLMEKDSAITEKDAEIQRLKKISDSMNNEIQADKKDIAEVTKFEAVSNNEVRLPVYYQMQVVDKGMMDYMERKTSGLYAIVSKLCFKKKSRQDIVRLVSGGNLSAEQLEQIHVGMESGLTEEQLEQLINNNLTPDRMAKIILIAKSDNKRKQMN